MLNSYSGEQGGTSTNSRSHEEYANQRRVMSLHRRVLLYLTVAAIAAIPALAQNVPAGGKPVGTDGKVSVPDFSGTWQHPSFPWFEPPASGPGRITNLSGWQVQMSDGQG